MPIGSIDISPTYAGKRDIAVGIRTGDADEAEVLWVVQSGGYAGWKSQDLTQLNDAQGDPVGDIDIEALKFSPTYVGDAAIAIVFSNDEGAATDGTFYNIALRDLSSTSDVTGWAFTSSVEVKNQESDAGDSPDADEITIADLELPSDFSGQSASLRRAYISTDDGYITGLDTGIFRIDDTTVYTLMDTTTSLYEGKRIHSIAYYGTYASGKLIAGEAMGDACTAAVPTWFTDSPTVCPVPCWYPALKPPTGAGADCCGSETHGKNMGNADVIWSKDGTLAYAGTSSLGIVHADGYQRLSL
jgi:hypothetical protein